MKRLLFIASVICLALMTASCVKENPGDTLTIDWIKLAQTVITTKGDTYEDTVTSFASVQVKKTSEFEGKSWFVANSDGKMVYDAFMLSIYFDDLDKLNVGDPLPIDRFMFTFFYSSNSEATTYEYQGSIFLAEKADDHIVLHFNNLSFSCSFGDYVTNGFLYCPLEP